MPNDYFKFKQFTVWQGKCAMKVGTDGVLLGAWASVVGAGRVLDIGCGTGLLALMVAQRSNAEIEAVEVDEGAYVQAGENVKQSKWADRIRVKHLSFQDYVAKNSVSCFDFILTNPPYFTNSLKAPDGRRSLARHTDSLPFVDLLSGVKKLLSKEGKFAIVLPYVEGCLFIAKAAEYSLYCTRKTNVYGAQGRPVKRMLCQFEKSPSSLIETDLVIEKAHRHDYTYAYWNLTKDFYLNF